MPVHRAMALRLIQVTLTAGALLLTGCTAAKPPGADLAAEIGVDTSGAVVNLDTLRAQVDLLAGPVRHYTRRGRQSGQVVDVTVQRIGKTRDIDPTNGPTPSRLIARIKNLDPTDTTEMYGFLPQTEYLVRIGHDFRTGAAVRTFLRVPSGRTGSVTVAGRGPATDCTPHHPPGVSKVTFAHCWDHSWDSDYVGSDMTGLGSIRSALTKVIGWIRPKAMAEAPIWFSCVYGCCTT